MRQRSVFPASEACIRKEASVSPHYHIGKGGSVDVEGGGVLDITASCITPMTQRAVACLAGVPLAFSFSVLFSSTKPLVASQQLLSSQVRIMRRDKGRRM